MSRKSIVFWSLVCIPSSDSASESASPGLPTFFLFFYVLLFGSLLNAACCAAPSINVNFYFSSNASSCSSSSRLFMSPCGSGVLVVSVCIFAASFSCLSIPAIFFICLASIAYISNYIFYSILRRLS
jgi:hypothetical protein